MEILQWYLMAANELVYLMGTHNIFSFLYEVLFFIRGSLPMSLRQNPISCKESVGA